MKKILLMFLLSLCLQTKAFAGKCPEDSIVEEAKKAHADFITEIYDVAVGSPSDSRNLSACLGSIEELGNIFSMGVSLPSFDDVLDKVCDEADSYLQNSINEAKNKLNEMKDEVLEQNPTFSVVLSPDKVVNDLLGRLK